MVFTYIFFAVICFMSIYIFHSNSQSKMIYKEKKYTLPLLLAAGFFVRIIFALFYSGHPTDMACFNAWSDMLRQDGFSSFYTSDAFTDYPPGYMYILYILSFIKDIFGTETIFTYTILKLPAILSDLLIAACVYKLCEKYDNQKVKSLLSAFFLFNPSVILNSAVWGQVDSVFTAIITVMLYMLSSKKTISAYFFFAIAIFVKPQALFYAPILLCAIAEFVFLEDFSYQKLLKNLIGGVCAIIILFVLTLPFGTENVILQYINTLGSYNYASVNAYNLWSALGMNWAPVTALTSFFGYLFIVTSVLFALYHFFKNKFENRYYILSAFICFAVFVLSVKMHERYAFPVMALLLCSYAISKKKEEFYFYLAISVLQFFNTFDVLFFYDPANAFTVGSVFMYITFGWLNVVALLLFIIYLQKNKFTLKFKFNRIDATFQNQSTKEKTITKKDIIIIALITAVYSVFALYNLGDAKSPKTYELISEKEPSITLELSDETEISKMNLYFGYDTLDESKILNIKTIDQNDNITFETEVDNSSVFCWKTIELSSTAKKIILSSSGTISIYELGLFSGENMINIVNAPHKIIDEQNIVPYVPSYRNSTYFDEIYHARTAYEFIHKLPVYEWTHPPLGKSFISMGINMFGMNPFGWRIVGTLFGILMIPVLYIFSKKMFGMTWISALSTIAFSSDFMHFTQSRIATIDVYVTFFIILMFMFMYKYIDEYDDNSFKKSLAALAFSGLFMGFAIACKWTGVYAGAGLAVVFFAFIFTKRDNKNLIKTLLYCLIFFVLVPIMIYTVSYIPFLSANKEGLYGIIQNQIDIFSYHGNTVVSSKHPFSSPWYQWIIDYRPIWYYTGTSGDLSENISAFGNPAVWIIGLFSFMYCIFDTIKYKNKNAAFLTVAYLANLLPWILVERTTFIYHYFPCVPFLVLMTAHAVCRLYEKNKKLKTYFIVFSILCVILFIMFYPSISGFPINGEYVRTFLKWLPSWHLIN